LDRLIFISANPDVLHIYEPVSGADTTVALPKPALCLDVSPDGKYAAVGHDGALSWVDLTSASIAGTFPVAVTVKNVILGPKYAWIISFGALNLRTGEVEGSFSLYDLTNGVLSADGRSLYLYPSGLSENDMTKYDVSAGAPGNSTIWPYRGDYPDCGPYYVSTDGTRIYLACGTIVHASSDPSSDMRYAGTLPVLSIPMTGLAESASLHRLAVISSPNNYPNPNASADTVVQLFSNDYFNPAGALTLEPFAAPGVTFAAHAQAVFFNAHVRFPAGDAEADDKFLLSPGRLLGCDHCHRGSAADYDRCPGQ